MRLDFQLLVLFEFAKRKRASYSADESAEDEKTHNEPSGSASSLLDCLGAPDHPPCHRIAQADNGPDAGIAPDSPADDTHEPGRDKSLRVDAIYRAGNDGYDPEHSRNGCHQKCSPPCVPD